MDVDKTSRRYAKQELLITVALFLIALLIAQVWLLDEVVTPAIVGAVFSLTIGFALAMIWRYVAKKAPDSLPTFYTAVSGFRLLLALATMFVYYLICGRDAMLVFFLVFMVFYFALLVHHSIFFARVTNHS